MFTFSFFVGLTHFFRLKASLSVNGPKGTYCTEFPSVSSSSAELGRDSVSEEGMSENVR